MKDTLHLISRTYLSKSYTLPGALYFVFKEGVSGLMQYLNGEYKAGMISYSVG